MIGVLVENFFIVFMILYSVKDQELLEFEGVKWFDVGFFESLVEYFKGVLGLGSVVWEFFDLIFLMLYYFFVFFFVDGVL